MWKRIGFIACSDPGVDVGLQRATGMAEIRRHDAHDDIGVVVDAQAFPQNIGIRAKLAAPETIAKDHTIDKSGDVVVFGVDATNSRSCAEQGEIVRVGGESFDAFRAVAAAEVGVNRPDHRDVLENSGALLQIDQLGFRHADVGNIGAAQIVKDADQLFLVRVGQRPEQDGVNDAEGRDVRANAQRQGENGDDHEARIFDQGAPGVADVSKE